MSMRKLSELDVVYAVSAEAPGRKAKHLDKLMAFLLKFKFFHDIRQRNGLLNFQEIAMSFHLKKYCQGDMVYKKSESRSFNYIVKGSVALYTNRPFQSAMSSSYVEDEEEEEQSHFFQELQEEEYFGERLFIAHSFRVTAAKATSATEMIQLDLPTLYKTFSGYFVFKELEDQVAVLRNVVALRFLSSRKLQRILQLGQTKKVHNGQVLFRQGQDPQCLFIIMAGEVTLTKKADDPKHKTVCLSILPAFEVLGFTQIVRGERYYSTAVCTRDSSQIISLNKEIAKEMFDYQLQNQLGVYRYKEDWRKTRAELIQRTASKCREMQSQNTNDLLYSNNKYLRMLTEPAEQIVQFGLEDRQKLFMTELESARKKRVVRRFLSQDKRQHESFSKQRSITSMGNQLYQKYMQRKTKKDMMLVYKYTNVQTLQNPEGDKTLLRPLYVHPSNAVKNTKRQLKASRRRLYEQMLSSSIKTMKE